MAGHDLTYNGVRLIGIFTNTIESVPVRDDSGTDQWYVETTLGVSTIVNVSVFTSQNPQLGVIGNQVQGVTAQDVCRNAIERLEVDRCELAYRQDGVVMFASSATTDANNGPKVVSCSVKPMGKASLKIDFVVKIAKVGCSENPPPVIGNRFQVVDEIDESHRTTRTWRGKIRLSSAVRNVHDFRELHVPVLSDGFKRTRLHFHGELNALELSYEIVDRQLLGDAPPQPAISMIGNHTEALSQDGASSIGEVYIRLDGAPGTDKQILLERCMRVISSRVQADRFAAKTGNWRWLELVIIDHLGQDVCAVEARARVQRALTEAEVAAGGGVMKLGNMVLSTLGRPLDLGGDYSRFRTIPPALYPCSTAGLFASALSCPCCDHSMPQIGQRIETGSTVNRDSGESTSVTYNPGGPPLEIPSPGLSSEQSAAMYTFSRVEWQYDVSEGIVALPYGDRIPGKDGETVAHIRLNEPTASVLIKIAAERVGEYPTLPERKKFKFNGIEFFPLRYRPRLLPPEYQGDGAKLYTADLEMTCSLSRVPGPNDYVVSSLPWDNQEASAAVPSAMFKPVLEGK